MPVPQFGDITFPVVLGELDINNVFRTVAQTVLTQTIQQEEIFRLTADRVFFFGSYNPSESGEYGQLAEHNYFFEVVTNAFFEDPEDNLTGYDQALSITQYLGFTPRELASAYNAVFSGFTANSRVAETELASGSNSFSFLNHDDRGLSEFALLRSYNISNTMLSDTAEAKRAEELFDYFDFDETAGTGSTNYGRGPGDSVIQDHVSFKITGGPTCPDKEYSPFVGSSGDASYDPVSESAPSLGSATLRLTHPQVSPTLTLTLKNPEFGNDDNITFAKVDRTTRGGDRKIFSDKDWVAPQVFELRITNIDDSCHATIDDIIDFLNTSLGDEIGLRDWEGRDWKGVILTPETEVIPEVSGHTVVITFEGELV